MKTKLFFVFAIILAIAYGCSDLFNSNDFDRGNETGKVIISLTDAPFPIDSIAEANVAIDWIKLKKTGIEVTEEGETDTMFITLEVLDTFNLLELTNGDTTILGELDSVPAGEYKEIRMHVTWAEVVLNDGSEFDLKIPSGGSSGLKIKVEPALVIGDGAESLELLLDFDVSRSFKLKGSMNGNGKGQGQDKGIKGFMFKPVIRAVNVAGTGSVAGTVTEEGEGEAIKSAHLYLLSGEDTVASAKTDKEGFYRIIGIPEDTYELVCTKGSYVPDTVDVTITAGVELTQDFALVKEEKTDDE